MRATKGGGGDLNIMKMMLYNVAVTLQGEVDKEFYKRRAYFAVVSAGFIVSQAFAAWGGGGRGVESQTRFYSDRGISCYALLQKSVVCKQ